MVGFRFIVTSILLIVLSPICKGQMTTFVDHLRKHQVLRHAQVGVSIHDIDSGQYVDGDQEQISLIPASSLKLLSTLSALHYLGEDYRYTTLLAHDGVIDADGTLQGNLYVIGSGDPSFGSDRITGQPGWKDCLASIVKRIKLYGITCIDGKVIADESIFDSFPVAPSWQWNDLGNYYAGGAWGININENEYEVWYNSSGPVGQGAKLMYTNPVVDGLQLQNEVTIDSSNTGDNAYIFGGPYDFTKRIVGTIPQKKELFKIKGSIPNPPRFVSHQLFHLLSKAGIPTGGFDIKFKKNSKDALRVVFDTMYAPPLITLVTKANYYSINQYCEAFAKTIAAEKTGNGSGSEGIAYIKNFLTSSKINIDALHLEDGSGLSARNLISPYIFSHFLASYGKEKGIPLLQKILPKAGAEGTVSGVNAGGGNVWMKSGSMNGIQSFTGICKSKSGRWISFSIIINGYNGKYKDVKPLCERIINQIYSKY